MELWFTNKLLYDYDTAIKKIKELEKENKRLKKDLAFKETMLDNVRAEYESLQNVIKKLKKRVKEHTTYSVKAEFIKKFWE